MVIKVDGELWVRALSARYGQCLLTGDPVRIGDRVYIRQNARFHWRQRILASEVEERLGRRTDLQPTALEDSKSPPPGCALEAAGVEFTNGDQPGMRLKAGSSRSGGTTP